VKLLALSFFFCFSAIANEFPSWVPNDQYFLQQNLINSSAYFRQLFFQSVATPAGDRCLKLQLQRMNGHFDLEWCFEEIVRGETRTAQVQLQYKGSVIFTTTVIREGANLRPWTFEEAKLLKLPSSKNVTRYELTVEPMGLEVSLRKQEKSLKLHYRYPFEDFNLFFDQYFERESEYRRFSFTCRNCDSQVFIKIESRPSKIEGLEYEHYYSMNQIPGYVSPKLVTTLFAQAVSGAVQLVSNDIVNKIKLSGLPAL